MDSFLIVGTRNNVDRFTATLNKQFKLGCLNSGSIVMFLGYELPKDPSGSATISVNDEADRISPIKLDKVGKQQDVRNTDSADTKSFHSFARTLLYLGQAVIRQACLMASKMQQRLGPLRVSYITEANTMVRELLRWRRSVKFTKVRNNKPISIVSFSNASHAGSREMYGQSGILTGLKIESGSQITYHPVMCAFQ